MPRTVAGERNGVTPAPSDDVDGRSPSGSQTQSDDVEIVVGTSGVYHRPRECGYATGKETRVLPVGLLPNRRPCRECFGGGRERAGGSRYEQYWNGRDVFGFRCPAGHTVDDVRLGRGAKCRDCGEWYSLDECVETTGGECLEAADSGVRDD